MDPNSLVKAVVASGCCNKRSNGNNCGTVPKYVSTSAMPPTNNYMYPPQMMLPQQFQYPMFMPMPMPVYQDGGCHHRPPQAAVEPLLRRLLRLRASPSDEREEAAKERTKGGQGRRGSGF